MKRLFSQSLKVVWLFALFVSAGLGGLSGQTFRTFGGNLEVDQSLIQGSDGRLYGTSSLGGANGAGFLFAVHTDGTALTILYNFPHSTGDAVSASDAGLLQGSDGRLYGTTAGDQSAPAGGVFALNTDGTGFTMLHSFAAGEGSAPRAALTQGSDGRLYGTTWGGGTAGTGTIFALEPDGTGFATLYSFPSSLIGVTPTTLLEGGDGRLYGCTPTTGTYRHGTIFALNRDGTGFTTLYTFTAGPDGGDPGRLILGRDGRLYGTTQVDGANGFGTIFAINTDGTGLATLCNFIGSVPVSLIQGNGGRLYGETRWTPATVDSIVVGGSPPAQPSDFGTVFVVNPDGTGFTTLYSSDSNIPTGSLVQGGDGSLYGSTILENLYALAFPSNATVPVPQSIAAGGQTTLTAGIAVSGSTFQWQLNGVNVAGATDPTLWLSNIGTTQAGNYAVAVINPAGTVASATFAVATVTVPVEAHLVNLSARAFAGTGSQTLTAGFVVNGPNSKQILIRGIGPALSQYSITGLLANPQLTVCDSSGAVMATDAGWGSAPAPGSSPIAAIIQPATNATFGQVYAFPLPAGSADCAMLATLPSSLYSAQISGINGTTGVALAELYDADTGTPASHLINISGRAFVGTGPQVFITGFVISGSSSETVLIRGVGPTLGGYGVSGALTAPQLTLFDSSGNVIATDTGWGNVPVPGSSAVQAGVQPATAPVMASVYAFPLPAGSADCAMVVTLPPGAYTAEVSGLNGSTGVALAEVYDIP